MQFVIIKRLGDDGAVPVTQTALPRCTTKLRNVKERGSATELAMRRPAAPKVKNQ